MPSSRRLRPALRLISRKPDGEGTVEAYKEVQRLARPKRVAALASSTYFT